MADDIFFRGNRKIWNIRQEKIFWGGEAHLSIAWERSYTMTSSCHFIQIKPLLIIYILSIVLSWQSIISSENTFAESKMTEPF
jgi:hypothetical protein